MELSPQDIREVQFREKMRGYHQDDVDELLVRVATTLELLNGRVRDAEAKALEVEARLAEVVDTEESLRRTLVLAQRTADLALQEAREEAEGLVSAARAENERLSSSSDELKQELIAASQVEIRHEMTELEARRDALVADVAALDSFIVGERGRLADLLAGALEQVQDGSLALTPPPALATTIGDDDEAEMSGGDANSADAIVDQPLTQEMAAIAIDDLDIPEDGDGEDGPEPAWTELVEASAGGEAVDLRELASIADPGSEPDQEDAFLAELRLAVTDEEPLGPRNEDFSGADHEEIDLFARERDANGRFGSRLRRRR